MHLVFHCKHSVSTAYLVVVVLHQFFEQSFQVGVVWLLLELQLSDVEPELG
jgi:hypothetical protein